MILDAHGRAHATACAALLAVALTGPGCRGNTVDRGSEDVLTLTSPGGNVRLASDGASLFVSPGDGSLASVPVHGGRTTTLVAPGTYAYANLVGLGATDVYFLGPAGPNEGAVYGVPKAGGPVVRVSVHAGVQITAATIAHGDVVWTEQVPTGEIDVVSSAAPDGPPLIHAPTVGAGLAPSGIAMTSTIVLLCVAGAPGRWFSLTRGATDGGVALPGSGSFAACDTPVGDDANVYYLGGPGESLVRLASDGTITTLAAETGASTPLALDADGIYLGTRDGAVVRVGKGGGTLEHVADATATDICADDGAIYWAASGTIRRLAK